jgi:hypothetical protein
MRCGSWWPAIFLWQIVLSPLPVEHSHCLALPRPALWAMVVLGPTQTLPVLSAAEVTDQPGVEIDDVPTGVAERVPAERTAEVGDNRHGQTELPRVLPHVRKRLFPSENGGDLYSTRRHATDDPESADNHLAEWRGIDAREQHAQTAETVQGALRLQRCGEPSGQRSAARLGQ